MEELKNLTLTQWLLLIAIILMVILIIIIAVLIKSLKTSTNKTVTAKIGELAEGFASTTSKVLKALNLEGVADVIGLIKEIIKSPEAQEDAKSNDKIATN